MPSNSNDRGSDMSREDRSRDGGIGSTGRTRDEQEQFEGRNSGLESGDSWGDENVDSERSSSDRSRSGSSGRKSNPSDEDRVRSDKSSDGNR